MVFIVYTTSERDMGCGSGGEADFEVGEINN